MSTYYGKEEETETSEMQLDNFRAQAGATEAVDVWARDTLGGIYDQTLVMWNQAGDMRVAAEERGDIQAVEQLTTIQNNLTEVYQGTEHMQQALLHSNADRTNVLEAAQALARQKNEIETELFELVTAVEGGDYNHPQVQQLMDNVESDVYEMVKENAFEDAYESASEQVYDNVISDMYTVIRKTSPQTTYATVERFFLTLKGEYALNDIQRGLLAGLVNTITLDRPTS
ncbi:MAG: hypothetical protein H0X37_26695 [Herpetosiphonaceae bacterium]|nr:hypothetical protein [Herpetosiphonaceae bacterium]